MISGDNSRYSIYLFYAFLCLLFFALLTGILNFFQESGYLSRVVFLYISIIFELIIFGGSYLIFFRKALNLKFGSINKSSIKKGILVWFVSFFFSQIYSIFLKELGVNLNYVQYAIFKEFNNYFEKVLALIFVGLVAPLAEEIFFRGSLFAIFRKRTGFFTSSVSSSAIFGILHGFHYFIPIFFFGMLLCYLVEKTEALDAAYAAHAINNLVAVSYYLFSG
ncbi:MAG: CPBP family intramembrane metalloprotease [Actinobacteria bacterium]|nr:CPBP family intramembrane metalloprotease [Actinomycetota bacterium]